MPKPDRTHMARTAMRRLIETTDEAEARLDAILNEVKAGKLRPKAAAEQIHADRALMMVWIMRIEAEPILDRVSDDAQLLERLKRGTKRG
jgi:hypothetical protein